jgi:MbtH protein
MSYDEEETYTYLVVKNHEEQYSIWPDFKPMPEGWEAVGKSGSKSECLAFINEVWTDMRPKSLRDWMDKQ